MARNELPPGFFADVVTLVALCEAVQSAATPEEKAAAEEALRGEGQRQLAASLERSRQRLRDRLRFNAVLRAAGEEAPDLF